jgi:hypothetical protein
MINIYLSRSKLLNNDKINTLSYNLTLSYLYVPKIKSPILKLIKWESYPHLQISHNIIVNIHLLHHTNMNI